MTTVTAFIKLESIQRKKKELAQLTVALYKVDIHKATQLSILLLKSETKVLFKVICS